MYLTHEIIDAICAAVGDDIGGQRIFAQKVGTSCANISRWQNGKNRRLCDKTWKKLLPHIAPYLHSEAKDVKAERTPSRRTLSGVTVNIFGIPHASVIAALKSADFLTEEQRRELAAKIFYDNFAGDAGEFIAGSDADRRDKR